MPETVYAPPPQTESGRGFRWASDAMVRAGDRMRISVQLLAGLFGRPRSAGTSELVEVAEVKTQEDGTKEVIFKAIPEVNVAERRALADAEVPFIIALGPHGYSPENQVIINGRDVAKMVRQVRIDAGIDRMTTLVIEFAPTRLVVLGSTDRRAVTSTDDNAYTGGEAP